ncbi:DUF4189 domain-containing protein [Myxococcus qinghaiensis]|uniref:DUF4189 domain-containing protein n=1 Tax=Myxococcus qinghaiensis TaxID=2906758 RepID=UPI0020A83091|nr:DUF4189 domain-containing protein [Myxococcus qinghaiensis]MCP3162161.1 DUF4189 domain-containing protein [Myxococcus qinghaiensis]
MNARRSLVIATLMVATNPALAASAVATADDMTYGYSYNQPTQEAAERAALKSCQRRTRRACQVHVSCDGPGFGSISFSRKAGGHTRALGASCGVSSIEDAYVAAVQKCNSSGAGKCGWPRIGWNDRFGETAEDAEEGSR